MAATIEFQIGDENVKHSFGVENDEGKISISKLASALRVMRQSVVDKALNKYVEAEKKERAGLNQKGKYLSFGGRLLLRGGQPDCRV